MPHTPQSAFVRLLQSITDARNIAPGDRVGVRPHVIIMGPRDGLAALKHFRLAGGDKVANPERFALFSDDNLPAPDETAANQRKQLHEAARQAGLKVRPGAGCEVATVLEERLIVPGELAASNLPEVGLLGGIGAGGLRATVRDVAELMTGAELMVSVPETTRVNLTGQRLQFVGGRDVFWGMIRELDRVKVVGRVIEIGGPALANMSLRNRMALAAQPGQASAVACFCVPDREGVQELNRRIQRPYTTIEPEKGAGYVYSAEFDVARAQLSLLPAGGFDDWRTVGESAGDAVTHVILGGQGSLGIEDIRQAVEIIKQRRLNANVRCDVIPNSREVYRRALEEDCIEHLLDAGARLHPPGTSPASLAENGALVTCVTTPPGCVRGSVVTGATAACAGAVIHPERLDAQPQRDSKLSSRRPKT